MDLFENMKAHDKAVALAKEYKSRNLAEADTRHQLIDPILHEVLGWPRNRTRCEDYIRPGFADYVLERSDRAPLMLIEAKREGDYFNLPTASSKENSGSYVKVQTLLTDGAVSAAMMQVREYCLNIGCEVGAISNGREWVVFKTFQREQDWRTLRAFVISGLEYFSEKFIEAYSSLSFNAITEEGSLRKLLLDVSTANRELFYPKERIRSYDMPVDSNQYASSLRPIADRYFGVIDVGDAEFMESCYVSDREYDVAFNSARRRLEDSVTPYLQAYDVKNFRDSDAGGSFGNRLGKSVITNRATDVVILFGSKGVGKSTFLRRLLFHRPPQVLKKNAAMAVIDLLNAPRDLAVLRQTIWAQLTTKLDTEGLLEQSRDQLCVLFSDRFEKAVKQDLFGLERSSPEYNLQLNELMKSWKLDFPYVAERLAQYAKARHRVPIIVVDNTDHFSADLQDGCFSLAREIATNLQCLVVISMREERFHASSIHGVLDAFQNAGFHITPPQPQEVFARRLAYVQRLLGSEDNGVSHGLPERVDVEVCARLFSVFQAEFAGRGSSHLTNFLTACSHGNIRMALELFRNFLTSGYTNVSEMTAARNWTLQSHQVLKPFMIPSRFFYDERLSLIPNIFQVRSKTLGSHFTAVRILSVLTNGHDSRNPPFVPVAKVAAEIIEIYGMPDDFRLNMDVLLKNGLIEANNRLDEFSSNVDSVRISAYGLFMLNAMPRSFTYIELVSVDCAIAELATANAIATLSNEEFDLHTAHRRFDRVRKRLDKAETFLAYLHREELREQDLFRSHDAVRISPSMLQAFQDERTRVLKSAKRLLPPNRA